MSGTVVQATNLDSVRIDCVMKHATHSGRNLRVQSIPGAMWLASILDRHPLGNRVRYWTMTRGFPGVDGVIWHDFTVVGGTVCGWIDSAIGCIAASHMDPIEDK